MNEKDTRVYAKAIRFAIDAHGNQKRKYTGEPYWHHPVSVATKLMETGCCDIDMICAALLHDTVEDTTITLDDIQREFGSSVALMVFWLTEKTEKPIGNRSLRKEIECKFLSLAPDDVKTIKVCDLIDNTKTIETHDPEFAKVYFKEKKDLLLNALVGADRALWGEAMRIVDRYYAY